MKRINPRKLDIAGQRFGRLVAIEQSGNRYSGESIWRCECDCGEIINTTSSKLRSGRTKSCGCLIGEKHGMTRSPEYRTWRGMQNRCYNKKTKDYQDYGGRGITVCERWLDSFSAFLDDMGKRPSPSHSIDRIKTDGNYEPGNCKWSTPSEQSNNRRSSVVIKFDGRTLTAVEWANETGIDQEVITKRIWRGWSPERALTQPQRASRVKAVA